MKSMLMVRGGRYDALMKPARARFADHWALAEILSTVDTLGHGEFLDALDDHAAAAQRMAHKEVGRILRQSDVDSMAEALVVWTVLGDGMFAALRRLAQEDAARRQLGKSSAT